MRKRIITQLHKRYGKWSGYLEGRRVYHKGGERWLYADDHSPIDPKDVILETQHRANWAALGVAY